MILVKYSRDWHIVRSPKGPVNASKLATVCGLWGYFEESAYVKFYNGPILVGHKCDYC